MNLRFFHFYIDFTLIAALLAQCLALPSTLSPRAECTEGFKVTILNKRRDKAVDAPSELNAYVSGQVDGKYGMLVWGGSKTEWLPLTASQNTSDSVHETVAPPAGKRLAIPIQGENIDFCMPKNIISGRVYIVEGTLEFKSFLAGEDGKVLVDEPSAVAEGTEAYNKRWSFLEFTYKGNHIVVNLSFVDWVSLTLGFTLKTANETYDVPGLKSGSLEKVCRGLEDQTEKDGLSEWKSLCVYEKDSKKLLRVLSPNQYATLHPDAWEKYYDDYWKKFGEQTRDKGFTINTQDMGGAKVADGNNITCTMPGESLLCSSTTTPAEQFQIGPPQRITEIWGCNDGMFNTGKYDTSDEAVRMQYWEILPRLCAAMVRSTLLLDEGHLQPNKAIPPDQYYQPNRNGTKWPTNHYSRIVHEFLENNKGYAFAYDDVDPAGENSAGLIDTQNPKTWEITLRD